VRFQEILARLDRIRFRGAQLRASERGIAPPPESDLSRPINPTAGGYVWEVDSNGNLGLFFTGTEIFYFDKYGGFVDVNPTPTRPYWKQIAQNGVIFALGPLATDSGDFAVGPFNTASGEILTDHYGFLISGNDTFLNAVSGGAVHLRVANTNELVYNGAAISTFGGIATVGDGVPAQRGLDARTNVGAADGAAITVYAIPAGATNKGFRVTARIYGFGGVVTSGIYSIVWTEGGVAVTKNLSITAVDTDADLVIGIQPDASTNVTAQITTLTGTSPKVNVLCLVEGVGSAT
jgi:hypothetical protein